MRIDSIRPGLTPDTQGQQDKKLREACQDFEAMFLKQLLGSMRKTVDKSELFGSGSEEEMFQEMMDTEVSKAAARTSPTGIADMLYNQVSADMQRRSQAAGSGQRGKDR